MPDAKPLRKKSQNPPVLDQGIVITGDIVVKLLGLKLLPVKLRLLISSKDLASALGLDWWNEEPERRSSSRATRRSNGAEWDRSGSAGSLARRGVPRNGSRRSA